MDKQQKEDITVIIEELNSLFTEAEDGEAKLSSRVGSKFHKRVERLIGALTDDTLF